MKPLAAGEPRTLGSYRLLGRLGEGGMGCVYLGRSAGGRTVAVKVIRAELTRDQDFRARFRREVAAARRVGGVWTAPVLDADTESEQPWVATGYVVGPSLAQAVEQFGPLPENGVRALGAGLAEALAHVHSLGLIHRDVKPSNVMLTPDGPLLIDFGIARAMDASATAGLTGASAVVGSPGHMSPEQVLNQPLGPACDVFQLGTVLVLAASGQPAFSAGNPAALLYKVAHEEPDLGPLHGRLRDAARACLAKAPADRPTPNEIAALLAPSGAGTLIAAGWLPVPLITQISRRAVDLLNLDAAPEDAPAAAAPPSAMPTPPQTPLPGRSSAPVEPLPRRREPPDAAPPVAPPAASIGGGRRGLAVSGATLALAAVTATALLVARPWSSGGAAHHAGLGAGTASASASADPASQVGPYKPVAHLCNKIDPTRFANPFGTLARAPQPLPASESATERTCYLVFSTGETVSEVGITCFYEQDPDFAKNMFDGDNQNPLDTDPPSSIGDQAFQKVERRTVGTMRFVTYTLFVRQSNLVVDVFVQTQAPPYSDPTAVTLTDITRDLISSLT